MAEEPINVTDGAIEPADDVISEVGGGSIDPVLQAKLTLAYWVLAAVAILLVAAIGLRVWPYPSCPGCSVDQIAYMVEGRETTFAFATTFLPSIVTLVLGYWFRGQQNAGAY